jgi:hypothetical protein
MTEQLGAWLAATLFAGLVAMNPYAASGAAIGCLFYLTYPSVTSGVRRLLLTVVSWGLGYATGIYKYPDGPPYEPGAMLWSAFGAALLVFVLMAIALMVSKKEDFPPWLVSVLKLWSPFGAKRGEKNGE